MERAPKHAGFDPERAKTYRPPEDQVFVWHTVGGGYHESLRTVAQRYNISVEKLIEFNFPGSVQNGRINPEVVNWYLHNHNGFNCPLTRDKRNRMFKGNERIAVPYMGVVEIGEVKILTRHPAVVRKPTLLDGSRNENVLAGQKYIHEFKFPAQPREIGYFVIQAKITIEFEILREGLIKTYYKKWEIKWRIERKLHEDLKETFSIKVNSETMNKIVQAIKEGSIEKFKQALYESIEASLKYQMARFGKHIKVELEGQISTTPVTVRVNFEYNDVLVVEGFRLDWKAAVKVGIGIGLSKEGWKWVIEKVGGEALKRFLAAAGRALAGTWEFLVAEGLIWGTAIGIGVVGAFALTSLLAWIVADASRKRKLVSLATWYSGAFLAKVFGEPRPASGSFPVEDVPVRQKLIELGEADAVEHARRVLLRTQHPTGNGSDSAVLDAFRQILLRQEGGKWDTAKWKLRNALEARVQEIAGR